MTTPTDIITNVLTRLERPDLRSVAETHFSAALAGVHSMDRFARDLKDSAVVDFVRMNDKVSIMRSEHLPRLRKMYHISEWQGYTEPVTGVYIPHTKIESTEQFKDLAGRENIRDYYGFEHSKTYGLLGPSVVLSGVSDKTECITFQYVSFPTLTRNSASGALETDSWICAEFDYMVEAYLQMELAGSTRDRKAESVARERFSINRADFMRALQAEILS